jgi:hypothetical protein
MKQKCQVDTRWSPNLAYVIGIIATDGNLSKDERHIVITSKDKKLLQDIKSSLFLSSAVGKRITNKERYYYVLQIGDRHFYQFLESIGLTQNKSKTIGKIEIPKKYFSHFLRGCVDGDGNIDVFIHKESKHRQLRLRLASASVTFVKWIHKELQSHTDISGGWIYSPREKSWHVLTYGKKDSIEILKFIYSHKTIYLGRKYSSAKEFI